jgi:hypothetical protein
MRRGPSLVVRVLLTVVLLLAYGASSWTPRVHGVVTVTEKLACYESDDNDSAWTSNTDVGGTCAVGPTMSIANNAYGLCFIANAVTTSANLATPALTGGSLTTWTEIGSVSINTIATPTLRVSAHRGLGSGASAAALTATYSANQLSVNMHCFEVTNPDLGGTNGSTATAQFKTAVSDSATTCAPDFDNALNASQVVFNLVAVPAGRTFTGDTSFTLTTELENTAATIQSIGQYLVNGSDDIPTLTIVGGATALGCLAVEVTEAAGAGGGPPAGSLMMMGVGR